MRRGTIKFLLRILVLSMGLLVPTKTLGQNQKVDEGYELFKKGQVLYGKEEYEKSIKYFDSALAIGTSLKETNLIWLATFLKGNVYMFDDQNQNALEAYTESIRIAKKSKNYKRELISYSGLVLVYDKTHQYAKAVKLSDKILSSIDTTDLKDTSTHGNIITTSIEAYLDTERYDLVLKYADQGIALSKKFDNKMVLVDLYIKKGAVYYRRKKHATSLEYLSKAETMLQNNTIPNPFYPTVNASYFMASIAYQQGNYEAAIKRLHTNIEASKEKDLLKLPVLQSHLLLANCYGEIKNFKEALHWNDRYVALNEAFQKRKDKTVNKIYEKEATILKGSIAALKSEYLQSEKIKKYAYGVALVLFLFLMIGMVVYYKRQKKNKVLFEELILKINALETKEKEQEELGKKEAAKEIVIDDEKVDEVLKGLSRLEVQEFYLRSDCNLRLVAKKVKTNATYLSKIINMHYQKNFNEYINDLRIDYALRRIKNDRMFRSFSVKSIATEIGYKSDYSFAKHFKAKTGLNPSYFIKNIQKQQESREEVLV